MGFKNVSFNFVSYLIYIILLLRNFVFHFTSEYLMVDSTVFIALTNIKVYKNDTVNTVA